MSSKIFVKSVVAAIVAVFLGVGTASAATIVLNPTSAPAPGPATFDVVLAGLGGAILDATIELNFSLDSDLVSAAATPTGNPFFQNAGLIKTVGCQGGFVRCGVFGGSNFGQPVSPDGSGNMILGQLTLQSNGAGVNVLVSPTSRFTPSGGSGTNVTNIGGVAGSLVAAVPEPASLVLLGLSVAGMAFLRRQTV